VYCGAIQTVNFRIAAISGEPPFVFDKLSKQKIAVVIVKSVVNTERVFAEHFNDLYPCSNPVYV
jgi:hypothetical protein